MAIPRALVKAVSSGKLVPFVGSGASMAVKQELFPTWAQLLLKLAVRLEEEASVDSAEIVRRHVNNKKLNKAADEAVEALGEAHFRQVMKETFALEKPKGADLSLAQAIWSLKPAVIVTTNYDRVFEWAKPHSIVRNSETANMADLFSSSAPDCPCVWHLHGHINDPDSLILSPEQYNELYQRAKDDKHPLAAAHLKLCSLISTHPLLFVGFGLYDEYVMKALETVLEIFRDNLQPSYALLKKGDDRAEQLWKQYKITVITYEDHGQPLVKLINQIRDAANTPDSVPSLVDNSVQPIPLSYTRWLADQCADITPFGMTPTAGQSVSLQQVYVPPLTTKRAVGDDLTEELRQAICEKKVVVVAGSGVSCATTGAAPSWKRLIESGAERCQALGKSNSWFSQVHGMLNPDDSDDLSPEDRVESLITAAEWVEKKLKSFGNGEFAGWLREHFENLSCDNPAVIDAIVNLDLPIITTNYDDLIARRSGLRYVTWLEQRKVGNMARNDDRRVLHLHGHWDHPETIVLGVRSYEAILSDDFAQTVMMSLGVMKSLLFIGCGDDGLNDPNFGNFLTWLKEFEKKAGVEHRHFRLVRDSDSREPVGRLFPVPYGKDFSNLPEYLQRLCPVPAIPVPVPAIAGTVSTANLPKDGTVPGLDEKLQKRPQSIEHYLSRLASDTCRLKLIGMGRSFPIDLPIADAFVPLAVAPSKELDGKLAGRFSDLHASDQNADLCDVFKIAHDRHLRGVILLGEPGAGKTTGARQLAWQLSSGQRLPEDLGLPGDVVPVLLRLRNLKKAALEGEQGLRSFLVAETESPNAADGLTSPGNDLWNNAGGPLLWILDGLDEVMDVKDRQCVSEWLRAGLRDRPHDRFLVTCRFAGYAQNDVRLGSDFAEFHVRPLDKPQIERFIHDWYTVAYRQLGQLKEADERISSLSEILQKPIYQTKQIRGLCRNPLMLTILCIVYHDDQKLPENRFELYKRCVTVLLEHWRQGLNSSPFDTTSAETVLSRVAWWMHTKPSREAAPMAELAKQAEAVLKRTKPEAGLGLNGTTFLNRMKDEIGILAGEQNGQLSFLHLSFQEYLAAIYAVACSKSKDVAKRASRSWWQEVALLSLRSREAYNRAFFRELLASGVAEVHPSVADACLAESPWVPVKAFVEVLREGKPPGRLAAVLRMIRSRTAGITGLRDLVLPLLESDDTSIRTLAGEVLTELGVKVPTQKSGIATSPESAIQHGLADITMVRIPAGEFMMGSTMTRGDREVPVHQVRLSRDFLLGRYPVTNALYLKFLDSAGEKVQKPAYWDNRRFNQPEQPVVGVSWDDAQAFCKWADCRLPTEAEWEYACRAGTTSVYSFGDGEEQLEQYAWYDKNSGGQTQPVGTRESNAWGLYDMHGNVWEWCHDWFGKYGKRPVENPSGPAKGPCRVLRGGSWGDEADVCRSSIRGNDQPGLRVNVIGFRVARTL